MGSRWQGWVGAVRVEVLARGRDGRVTDKVQVVPGAGERQGGVRWRG